MSSLFDYIWQSENGIWQILEVRYRNATTVRVSIRKDVGTIQSKTFPVYVTRYEKGDAYSSPYPLPDELMAQIKTEIDRRGETDEKC